MSEDESMRLTVVASEFPYPPTHGGRSDTWRRICAFVAAGAKVQLVCWYSPRRGGRPSPADELVVRETVEDLVLLPISLSAPALLRRVVNLTRWPSHITARAPTRAQWPQLLSAVRRFEPHVIWQDGLWGGVAADRLASSLGCRRFVRSHNVEHRYMAHQAALARSLFDRLAWSLTVLHLRRYETKCLRSASGLFDISVQDLEYWRGRGVQRGYWLPPTVRAPVSSTDARGGADVVYVGNLHTPNNVQGLLWFLGEVWPGVLAHRPESRALIAGSKPTPEVRAAVLAARGVSLVPDPSDVWELYRRARVLVNPVLAGSGMNIKSVEMLQMDCPIVSTSIGVGGLPEEVRRSFIVEDDPRLFSRRVVDALEGRIEVEPRMREQARRPFSDEAVREVLSLLQPPASSDESAL